MAIGTGVTVVVSLWKALVLSVVELLPISVECDELFCSVVSIVEGGVTTVTGAGAGASETEVVVLVSLTCLDDSPHPLTNGMIARLSAERAIQRDSLLTLISSLALLDSSVHTH